MPFQVLLIEDNRPDAMLVREALGRQGFDFALHEFNDAEAAIAYLGRMGNAADSPYPDVVVMDLNLPRGDGLEVLQTLRERPECANTPVIVMTSSQLSNDWVKAAETRNTHYLKPPELDAFLSIGDVVREALKQRRASVL